MFVIVYINHSYKPEILNSAIVLRNFMILRKKLLSERYINSGKQLFMCCSYYDPEICYRNFQNQYKYPPKLEKIFDMKLAAKIANTM